MRQIITRPADAVFDASAGTVTLPAFKALELGRLLHVLNVTRGVVLYDPYDPSKLAAVASNVITLDVDTTAHADTDVVQVVYEVAETDPQHQTSTIVAGARRRFRDSFATAGPQPNPAVWALANTDGHLVTVGGNAAGSKYLRISLNPLTPNSEVRLTSRDTFSMPMRVGFGMSASQRLIGQEIALGIAGTNGAGTVDDSTVVGPDVAITTSTIVVASNVATITAANHGLRGRDRICITGCPDTRMNVGPVIVTVVDANTFTVPLTIGNASYTSTGGMIRILDPLQGAYNGAAYLFENTTTTNATLALRRNGAKFRASDATGQATTVGSQTSTSPYSDAWNSGSNFEIEARFDELTFRSFTADSAAGVNYAKYSQVPEEETDYHLVIRARNLPNFTVPVGRITAISKAGTTTATVTTDVPHGLAVTDYVVIYGVRDQTNFANLTSQTLVASVPSSTTFTVVLGSAVTASSAGGAVWRVQGSQTPPAYTAAVQSVTRNNNILTVAGSTTWSTPLPGEYLLLHGLDAAPAVEGAYKVLRATTTTLELESDGPNFATINTGGVGIRMTDVRVHFVRDFEYTRHVVEVSGGRGNVNDINNSVPVSVTGSTTVAVSQATGSASVSNIWQAAGYGGVLAGDIASAAITSTTTTSAITPGGLANLGTQAHAFSVIVTAVSGTSPTMDVVVQESPDNGTNWVDVYHFERITATGTYVSPQLPATWGTRYRYVQTIAGTSPSFTRSLNRVMFSHRAPLLRQFFNRTLVVNTVNSVTPTYNVDGCRSFQLVAVMAAGGTGPVLQLQGSEDGVNWFAIGGTVTATAGATTPLFIAEAAIPSFVRVQVATAGSGSTLGSLCIKAIGN